MPEPRDLPTGADDPLAALRMKLGKKLTGFTADFPDSLESENMEATRPAAADFPVPGLLLLMLRNVLRFPWAGHGEKVRWSVYASVTGEPVVFELRKSGFTILRRQGSSLSMERVVGQLGSALRELEVALQPLAKEQVNRGCVTIANRWHEFDDRYRFFRNLAEQAYARADTPPLAQDDEPLQLDVLLNWPVQNRREGFFYSTAMIDAYFSCLEHRLILLRAFIGTPLAAGELSRLLAAKWDEKLKNVLNVTEKHAVGLLLGRLCQIKERIRNPFAHGGVENDGGSLFFHLSDIGAVPANFSRFKNSIRFNIIPIDADDHKSACAVFDELDDKLRTDALAGPHQILEADLDAAFDPETLAEYAAAVQGGAEMLEAWIERWSQEWERHANMDY